MIFAVASSACAAVQDIALDGLVYWVPMLVHALIDGDSVSLSTTHSSSNTGGGGGGGEVKHCGGKNSQLAAVLLSAIPFGTAALAAVAVGHSSEVRQERKMHVGLPLLAGGVAFMLLPLLLQLGSHVPAFVAVTVAVVAADATTGPFWVSSCSTSCFCNPVGSLVACSGSAMTVSAAGNDWTDDYFTTALQDPQVQSGRTYCHVESG